MTIDQRVFRNQLRRLILIPLVVSILIAAILEIQVRKLTAAQDWVDHTDVVLAQTRLLLRSVIDQETGLRGYILTGDEQFLQPYHKAETTLPGLFEQIRNNVSDNPRQQARLASVREAYDQWHSYAADAILRAARKDAALNSIEFNLAGKQMMDELRNRQQTFVDTEDDLKIVRQKQSERLEMALKWTLVGLIAVFGITLLYQTRNNIRAIDGEYATILKDLELRSSELNNTRQRLEVTLKSIGDAVIATDTKGMITFLNPVAEQLTQHSQEHAAGKHLDEVFRIYQEETRVKTESPFSKVMRLGSVVGLANHTVLVRPDGSEIAIDDSGAPIRDQQGEIFGVVLVFRDVTEQKEMLNILRTNEKLAAAGKLSASIAHEIHNPLETVGNLLYLVRKRVTGDSEKLIGMAEQELSRLVQITKNMLSLYRESKTVVPTKLSEVVDSVSLLLQRRIRDKHIQFSTDIRTDARISAFPAEMRQLVSNLVANAIDAVEPGAIVEVIVQDCVLKDGKDGVSLTVRDVGSGISQENLPKLFRPFFTTKGENGTGLGLWISHGIVSKHGGYIEVNSETSPENHGTTFNVVFPKLADTRAVRS